MNSNLPKQSSSVTKNFIELNRQRAGALSEKLRTKSQETDSKKLGKNLQSIQHSKTKIQGPAKIIPEKTAPQIEPEKPLTPASKTPLKLDEIVRLSDDTNKLMSICESILTPTKTSEIAKAFAQNQNKLELSIPLPQIAEDKRYESNSSSSLEQQSNNPENLNLNNSKLNFSEKKLELSSQEVNTIKDLAASERQDIRKRAESFSHSFIFEEKKDVIRKMFEKVDNEEQGSGPKISFREFIDKANSKECSKLNSENNSEKGSLNPTPVKTHTSSHQSHYIQSVFNANNSEKGSLNSTPVKTNASTPQSFYAQSFAKENDNRNKSLNMTPVQVLESGHFSNKTSPISFGSTINHEPTFKPLESSSEEQDAPKVESKSPDFPIEDSEEDSFSEEQQNLKKNSKIPDCMMQDSEEESEGEPYESFIYSSEKVVKKQEIKLRRSKRLAKLKMSRKHASPDQNRKRKSSTRKHPYKKTMKH